MISANDYKKLIGFYKNFLGMEIQEEHTSYTLLKDPFTGQILCITNGKSTSSTSPGILAPDIEDSPQDLTKNGGCNYQPFGI